jgi:glycosyltransferase involved in cell wall biosynthesis
VTAGTPVITVIVPVHDTARYLPECLDSVLGQSLRDIEVICVDDASTDGSSQVLSEYARRDDRVRVLSAQRERNATSVLGPGIARNVALDAARGEYVAFVDSDDHISPVMLEHLHAEAHEHDAVVAMCSTEKFGDGGRREAFSRCTYDSVIPRQLDGNVFDWRALGDAVFELRLSACNKIYRRGFLEEHAIRFSEGIFYEDLIFTLRSLLEAERLVFVREPYYKNRRQRPGATTFQQGARTVDALEAYARLERFLTEHEDVVRLMPAFEAFRFRRFYAYLHRNDAAHISNFYDALKQCAARAGLDGNPHLTEGEAEIRQAILDSDVFEFVVSDYWRVWTVGASTRRRLKRERQKVRRARKRLKRAQHGLSANQRENTELLQENARLRDELHRLRDESERLREESQRLEKEVARQAELLEKPLGRLLCRLSRE